MSLCPFGSQSIPAGKRDLVFPVDLIRAGMSMPVTAMTFAVTFAFFPQEMNAAAAAAVIIVVFVVVVHLSSALLSSALLSSLP